MLRLLDGLPDRHFHSIRLDSPKKVDVDRLNGKLILNEEAASELEHHFKSRDHSPKLVCEIGSEIMTKIGIPDGYFQKILAQIIGCALTMNNYDLLEQMMTMVPEHITWDILAYNLARAYGRQENRAQLLEFTALAVSFGKTREQFIGPDFKNYLEDPEFLEVISKD